MTLPDEVKEELRALNEEQRRHVLTGLKMKLEHFRRKGRVPYNFDECPVCLDMRSTEAQPTCGECYIYATCNFPFDEGFRDDHLKGFEYFKEVRLFIVNELRKFLERRI